MDDLTALGHDGIRRSFDEHYGTMMDVEQDPTGAMWAIHKQADRIEELEAKLAELLAVAKRAVRLSLDHSDFKLYAMEPMHQAIAAAELKGQNDE
jgi:hypothetical protein